MFIFWHIGRRCFGSVLDIIPIADSVTKLTAWCEVCNKRAFFTLRKTAETTTELIAGAEVYMPVCCKHYVTGQVVKEATKAVPQVSECADQASPIDIVLAIPGFHIYWKIFIGQCNFNVKLE